MSQGIESTIECSTEGQWFLGIDEADAAFAHETIRHYESENRSWPWQQTVQFNVLFDWTAVGWVFLMVLFYSLQNHSPGIRDAGLMSSTAVSSGEFWRLVTATCLHADLGHLLANVTLGLLLLGLVMGRFGTGVGLLAALCAGIGGNLGTWLIYPEHRSLGASGVVLGCVGLLAAQALPFRKHPAAKRYAMTGAAAGVLLFVLIGLAPGTDVLAHFGGFVAGTLIGTLLLLTKPARHSGRVDAACAAIAAMVLLFNWWMALRAPGLP